MELKCRGMRGLFGAACLCCLLIQSAFSLHAAPSPDGPKPAQAPRAPQPHIAVANPPELAVITAKDDPLSRLHKERFNAAVNEAASLQSLYREGRTPLSETMETLNHLAIAAEPVLQREEYLKRLTEWVAGAKEVEAKAKLNHKNGVAAATDGYRAQYARANLEIRLLKLQQADKGEH